MATSHFNFGDTRLDPNKTTSKDRVQSCVPRILVANRGEIALRIIRSIRECGFSPVAVFSEADRDSLHVRFADEAYEIGPAPASESYLNIEKLITIAKNSKAFAIHPGYGFLAENAHFAKACEDEKIRFIGPTSKVIAAMGDKLEARKRAKQASVPIIEASSTLKNLSQAYKAAQKIGYPCLLKAQAGGGGKGMREVKKQEDLEAGFRLVQAEALKAFGDNSLYLEKYLIKPRHIEVQVFADHDGNVLILGDRECSIQRRHQKMIEEALAPHLKEDTRKKMALAAKKLAKNVNYRGAGTI